MRAPSTVALLGCAVLVAAGCGGDSPYEPRSNYQNYENRDPGGNTGGDPADAPTPGEAGRDIIVDDTGKRWDVTYGRKYGLVPEGYQFGLGPNAIRPINHPQMLSPGDPGYPADREDFLVIGASLDGVTRAYPLSVMGWHEVANEIFGQAHVAVAYWPLVNLAAVYSREIDGQVLTLGASGWTYDYTFVLYDRETETMWYHLEGDDAQTGVNGTFADRRLRELPSTLTRWNLWKELHPDTEFMDYSRGSF